jgi:hypothetical protein
MEKSKAFRSVVEQPPRTLPDLDGDEPHEADTISTVLDGSGAVR